MSRPEESREIEPAAHESARRSERRLVAFAHREETTTILVGPLPPPEDLAKYEEICSGAADRIISMAERQSEHRQAMEARVIEANCIAQRRGPAYGFALVLAALAIGGILLWNGKDVAGLATVITALASVVATFIAGKSRQKSELKKSQFRDVGPVEREPPHDESAGPGPGSAS
jgi:uncharacterized membrane protein